MMSRSKNGQLQEVSPVLNLKIDELKAELGEAMKLMMEIETKSVIGTPSPIMTPVRGRSLTPVRGPTESALTSSPGRPTGVRSTILSSKVTVSRGEVRGPVIAEIATCECPQGDSVPADPMADEQEAAGGFDFSQDESEYYLQQDTSAETSAVKKKLTDMGNLLGKISNLDLDASNQQQSAVSTLSDSGGLKVDPNKRPDHRKNLGLFFGHENWNLIMNMMIGFRAGVKS